MKLSKNYLFCFLVLSFFAHVTTVSGVRRITSAELETERLKTKIKELEEEIKTLREQKGVAAPTKASGLPEEKIKSIIKSTKTVLDKETKDREKASKRLAEITNMLTNLKIENEKLTKEISALKAGSSL